MSPRKTLRALLARQGYHMAPGVGHYGIFNGSKWRERIAPVVEKWIAQHEA